MALREYPVKKASSAPATGVLLYKFLMKNVTVPAKLSHGLWLAGQRPLLDKPDESAFRGAIPKGRKLELKSLGGKAIEEGENVERASYDPSAGYIYTFTGSESSPVLVSDLTGSAREELNIPTAAKEGDKVFNPNFVEYEELPELTKVSNELAALVLPKSISSWFGANERIIYSEKQVLRFLEACFEDLSSPEMLHLLNQNHMAWVSLAYIREKRTVTGDIEVEFYAQNPAEFYGKDLSTILPPMFFAVALLGEDPVAYHDRMDVNVWGAREAAVEVKQHVAQMSERQS